MTRAAAGAARAAFAGVMWFVLTPAPAQAQVDSAAARHRALDRLGAARAAELTRYAPPADTHTGRARILVSRPVWARDSLLVTRWVDTARAAPADPAPRTVLLRPRRVTVTAAAAAPPAPASDTLLRLQRSADFRVRHAALDRLASPDAQRVTADPRVRGMLITQLDSIGVRRLNRAPLLPAAAAAADREEYGEYVIALTRSVVRLRDTSAVRAVALAGLGTSSAVQRFVGEQGAASLPILDTVFALDDEGSSAVVTTWAHALAAAPSRLSATDSVFVYGRIVQARHARPIAFLTATRIAGLFELEPMVDSLAAESSPALSATARLAQRDLAAARRNARAGDWASRLRLHVSLACAGTIDVPRQDCPAMLEALRTTIGHADAGRRAETSAAARELLRAAQLARRRGGLTGGQLRIIQRLVTGMTQAR